MIEEKVIKEKENESVVSSDSSQYTLVNLPLYFLKFEGDYYYEVTTGEGSIQKRKQKTSFSSASSSSSLSRRKNHLFTKSSNSNSVKDCCYHCGSKNHYQSYCPLKKCSHCNLYGHDATTHHHHHYQHYNNHSQQHHHQPSRAYSSSSNGSWRRKEAYVNVCS
jgi:hypothetical protein